jgi:hypothetical protein
MAFFEIARFCAFYPIFAVDNPIKAEKTRSF